MTKKVLILSPFSHPSKCGIWSRVWSDAEVLRDAGYDVSIFSSNIIKGSNETSEAFQEIANIKIYRFKSLFSLGNTSMFWVFLSEFRKLNPDIVHTHGYRHPHSFFALILSKLLRKKVFLTTHAPFEKDKNRSSLLKLFDFLYDKLIGWWELKLYKNVIRISEWEKEYLVRLGLKKSEYIPNSVPEEFVKNTPSIRQKPSNRIIFMGRVDPVKRLEWFIYAAKELPEYDFFIRGPLNGYPELTSDLNNLTIDLRSFSRDEFIKELQSSDIYVLPSIREGLPFSLLESMSQGVLALTSNTLGGMEIIKDNINGYIFASKDELVNKIKLAYSNWTYTKSLIKKGVEKSQEYSLVVNGEKLLKLYS